jgi:DNA-binding NtrC family response regulator
MVLREFHSKQGNAEAMSTSPRPLIYLRWPNTDDAFPANMLRQAWEVHLASEAETCAALINRHEFLVGVVHLSAPPGDGGTHCDYAKVLCNLLCAQPHIRWVALISNPSLCSERNLLHMLATQFYDYHTMPVDLEQLLITLGHAYRMAQLGRGRPEGECEQALQLDRKFGMVGQSRPMRTLFSTIHKVGATDLNVVIRGESGTGKELTAQAIHGHSPRASGPFVAVNCGALPRELIQAELFGHEKGSFTGADQRRIGRIEAAQNGTLFLDEIGDLPRDLQANLLRFLQEKTINRVGGSVSIPIDVRVIAATHVNLEQAVEAGRFREDLYYRLNVLHMEMPPLRERGEDIELLANHFLRECAARVAPYVKCFSRQALDAIKAHPWPGNVREMVNRIQRAVVMCEGRLIGPRDLGLDRTGPNCALLTLAQARAKAEKEAIEGTLKAVRNNVSKAARHLDISRITLYRLMGQHAIDWQERVNS